MRVASCADACCFLRWCALLLALVRVASCAGARCFLRWCALLLALTLQLRRSGSRLGRPHPSTVVTRFLGTMGRSDSHPGPACPSRASAGWPLAAALAPSPPPPGGVSRVASVLLADMPSRSGPRLGRPHSRRTRGAIGCSTLFSPRPGLDLHGGGLPPCTAGSASASFVSRPARRSRVLRPAGSLSRLQRPVDIESFSRFVASSAVPTAAGRNNQLPGRDSHPLKNSAFSTAHGA